MEGNDKIMSEVRAILGDKDKLKNVMKNTKHSAQDRNRLMEEAESNPTLARQIEAMKNDPVAKRNAYAAGTNQIQKMQVPPSKHVTPPVSIPPGTPNVVIIAVGSEKIKSCYPPTKDAMRTCKVIPFKDNTMCMIVNVQSAKKNSKATQLAERYQVGTKVCGSVYVCNMKDGVLLPTTTKDVESLLTIR